MTGRGQLLFWNSTEVRLRAGWRILLFLVLLVAISVGLQFSTRAVLGSLPRTSNLVIYLLALAATTSVWIARRGLDRQSLRSLGLRWDRTACQDLLFGFGLSGLMGAAVFGAMWMLGAVQWQGWGAAVANATGPWAGVWIAGSVLLWLLPNLAVGWWEELVFRGYLFQNTVQGLGLGVAIALSCLLYGGVHLMNPHATLTSGAIIVLFGWLRLYGYLATGQLWLSMGMHMGWNFFQGNIFGYAASGHAVPHLLEHQSAGPDWMTGGAFGPEASLLVIPVVGLALGAMKWWSAGRDPGGRPLRVGAGVEEDATHYRSAGAPSESPPLTTG